MSARRSRWVLAVLFLASTAIVHGYISTSDFRNVRGAQLHSGCKNPCDDSSVRELHECLHLPGMGDNCDIRGCTQWEIRYVICATSGESGDCTWATDPNDWGAFFTMYTNMQQDVCANSGHMEWLFDDCQGNGTNGDETPCVTDECNDEVLLAEGPGETRTVCK